MFRREPVRTWRYIRQIERACRGAEPNAAHRAIAHLERERERVWVLTQNVDGLHVATSTVCRAPAVHGPTGSTTSPRSMREPSPTMRPAVRTAEP